MLCRAGFVNAPALPTIAARMKTGQMTLTSAPDSATYASETLAAMPYVRTRMRRRSTRSATTPPISANNAPGIVWQMSAAAINAARWSSATRSRMNNGTVTDCMPTPVPATIEAAHHTR